MANIPKDIHENMNKNREMEDIKSPHRTSYKWKMQYLKEKFSEED